MKVEASAYRDNLEHGIETKRLLRSGGWIEVLDQDMKVTKVVGEKRRCNPIYQ